MRNERKKERKQIKARKKLSTECLSHITPLTNECIGNKTHTKFSSIDNFHLSYVCVSMLIWHAQFCCCYTSQAPLIQFNSINLGGIIERNIEIRLHTDTLSNVCLFITSSFVVVFVVFHLWICIATISLIGERVSNSRLGCLLVIFFLLQQSSCTFPGDFLSQEPNVAHETGQIRKYSARNRHRRNSITGQAEIKKSRPMYLRTLMNYRK